MLPELTDEQRREALDKAMEARMMRSSVKTALKAGTLDPVRALALEEVSGMRIRAFLTALPGVGGTTADAALRRLAIAPLRRVRGLGCRQMERLVDWIENREH